MNLIDELQKLEQLHQNGSLTAEEFTLAKTLLLSGSVNSSATDSTWENEKLTRSKILTIPQSVVIASVALGLVLGFALWYLIGI